MKKYITRQAPLDPNHTHFILVDNGKLNQYGGEIELRANLESQIAKYKLNTKGTVEKIPIVVIVVGGGPNTVNVCMQSVKSNSPCVFIKV